VFTPSRDDTVKHSVISVMVLPKQSHYLIPNIFKLSIIDEDVLIPFVDYTSMWNPQMQQTTASSFIFSFLYKRYNYEKLF